MNHLRLLRRFRVESTALMLAATVSWSTLGYADTLYKSNSGTGTFLNTALTTPAAPGAIIQNYAEGTVATVADVLVFNNLITAASTFRISASSGGSLSLLGLGVLNPSAAITIQNGASLGAQTLTLGANGIDMSYATQSLTISSDTTGGASLTTVLGSAQGFNVRDGRTLTISTNINNGGNTLTIQGGPTGGGTVLLGGTAGAISGGGEFIINGVNTGTGNTVTLAGNNGAAGLGAMTVAGGSRLNIDQSAAGQSKLNDTAALIINRGTVNLQGTGGGTEIVGNVVLGSGQNTITRGAGTGVLAMNAITRSTGATLNVGTASIATTTNTEANGILGGWAVINLSDFSTAAFAAVAATTTAEASWNATLNEVITSNVTLSGARDVNSLKFNGAGAQTMTLTGQSLNVTSGGILRNQNFSTTLTSGTITAGGVADTVADELFLWNNQNTMTVNSAIIDNFDGVATTDVVNVTKAGGGSVGLTGVNTYSGVTTVAAGILNLGNNLVGGNVATFGTGNIINHGLIQMNKTTAATLFERTISNNISGSGAFTNLRGTTVLSGTNTYYGDTNVNAGILQADSAGGFSLNSRMILNAAGVGAVNNSLADVSVSALRGDQATAFVTLGANNLTLTGVDPVSNGTPQAYQGIISGVGGLIKNGLYTQSFTGAGLVSYTGTTTINAGILQTDKELATSAVTINNSPNALGVNSTLISNISNSLGASSTTSMNLANAGSTWQINNGLNQTVGSLAGVADSRVFLQGGAGNTTLTVIDNGGVPTVFNGIINSVVGVGSGSVIKEGTNTWVLGGGNTYSGATTINGGIIQIAAANPVQVISDLSAVVLANAAGVGFDLNGNVETVGSLAGGGALGGNVTLGATGRLTVGGDDTTTNLGGAISGGTAGVEVLVKVGDGTMTLSGTNTFVGDVVIRRGSGGITLSGGSALADTVNIRNFGNGTTLTVLDSETVGAVTGAQGTNIVLGAGATLTASYTNGTPIVLPATADTNSTGGRVIKGINTTDLTVGTLISGTSIPVGSYIVQILDGDSVLINAVPTPTTTDFAPTVTGVSRLTSNITGTGGYTKDGPGLLYLAGDSTYSGDTTINDGTIQVGGLWTGREFSIQDQLSNNSQFVFAATGTQNLTFANSATNLLQFERIGSLAGGSVTSSINLLAGSSVAALAVGGDDKSSTYSGRIIGANAGTWLIKEGTGTFTWNNPTATAADIFDGIIVVAGGGFTTGANGLDSTNVVRMGNDGVTFTSGVADVVALLEGGAGTTRVFPNAITGALFGNTIAGTGATVTLAAGTLQMNSGTSTALNADVTGPGTWQKNSTGILSYYGTSSNAHTGQLIITNGTFRMAALGAATGVGAPGIGSYGTLSAASSLRLTGGTLDLNGTTQSVAGIVASSTAGTIAIGSGNLTLSNQTSQSTATVITSNQNGVLNINGAGNLTLTGNSTNFGGTINVGSGQTLTLNRAGGALNSTGASAANINLGAGTLVVALADTIGSLAGSGNVTLTQGLTVNAGGATAASGQYSGTLSGAGAFSVQNGSLKLSGASNHTGGTSVTRGALVLDYSGGATNLIGNTGALTLAGGTLYVVGGASGPTIDAAGSTTLNAGASATFAVPAGFASAIIDLGAITRNAGSTLQIGSSSAATSTANLASGILGGYAVHGVGFGATGWAVGNGAGVAITALGAGAYTADTWAVGTHTDVVAGIGAATGATETVRFNTAVANAVALGGAASIATGGILVTGGVGANLSTITNGAVPANTLTSGNGADLIIHQYNSLGALLISADITGAIGLTKAGQGTVILDQNSSFTGAVTVGQGRLQVGNGGTTGDLGAGTGAITNNGVLAFNRTNALTVANVIQGNGWLIQDGVGGTLTLGHATTASTYTGRTSVLNGTLVALRDTALGAVSGITTVNSGAILDFGDGTGALLGSNNVGEIIALKGGTLRDNTTAAAQTIFNSAIALLGVTNTISSVTALDETRITAQIIGAPDADSVTAGLQPANLVIGGSGTVTLQNATNQWDGTTTVNAGATLQLGVNSVGSIGGLGDIINNGTVITNTNNGHLVLGNQISGSGNFVTNRNTVYLTADNTYTGTTTVTPRAGENVGVELRVGNDTYTGSLGTGDITVAAGTFNGTSGDANLRFHLLDDFTVSNTINLNPNIDTQAVPDPKNVTLLRQGLSTMTISGTLNIGPTNVSTGTQRAILQTESGGKLIFSGTLNGSANNKLNIVNNGIFVFGGSASNSYDGILSGNNVWIFNNSGTTTLLGVNTFNTGSTYVRQGTVVIGTGGVDTIQNDNDTHLLQGANLSVAGNETIGLLYMQRGSNVSIGGGTTLTVDDGAAQLIAGVIGGTGNLTLAGNNYMAMYNSNTATGALLVGQGAIQSPNLTNAISSFSTVTLGTGANAGGLEYIGTGETLAKDITLAGTNTTGNYIAANGSGALVISGNLTATATNTLRLIGQTGGYFNPITNQITGIISEGANVLSIAMSASGNDDRFGITSHWALTNAANDFSGGITVNIGMLEFGGDLGTGGAVGTSQLGDLTAARTINLGTNNFDGRRYDMFGGGDQIGAAGSNQGTNTLAPNSGSTGTIIFNSTNAATFTLLSNITLTQSFSSTTNPGSGQIINDGAGAVVIQGNLTAGASGTRNWFLDGSNTGANEISGIISDTSTTGSNTVGVIKEGAGTWRLSGINTYEGITAVNNGILELSGGSAIPDANTVSINADGGDGLFSGTAKLRVIDSETIGLLTSDVLTEAEIAAGQTLTISAAGTNTVNGLITGAGSLKRTTSAAAATMNASAKNSYAGITTIQATGAATGNTQLNVWHLADGGSDSGIGSSSNAAGNLIFGSDTAGDSGGILQWQGFNDQSTDRLFTMGLGAAGARINAAGTLLGTDAPAITFSNTGALAYTGAGARTLTLGGTTISDNEFRPQITDSGGVTSLIKADGGLWLINPDVAGNTYTGTTTIAAGTLAIQAGNALGSGLINITGGGGGTGLEIRIGITLANNITTTVADGALRVKSGTNVMTGLLTMTTGNTRFHVDSGASAELNNSSSALTGAGTLLKSGEGTLILSGVNGAGFTGQTAVRGGTLVLDYVTNNTSKLADAAALTLGGAGGLTVPGVDDNVAGQSYVLGTAGGTIQLKDGSHVEQVSATTLGQGANAITRNLGTSAINLEAITRAVGSGATIDFGAASIATTNNLNGIGGILNTTGGGAGTATGAYATVNKSDWAITGAAGTDIAITALAPAGYNNGLAIETFGAGFNTDIISAAASTGGAVTTNTLRFNAAQATTLTLGGNLSLQSAGILVTPNVGAFDTIITGFAIQNAATTANLDTVILHQHNILGDLQIDSVLQNNTGAGQITKSGVGKVYLNAINTRTGALNLNEGELQVGGTATAPTTATAATLGGANVAINMSQGSTLTFLSSNAAVQDLSTIQGGGQITLATGNTMPVLMDTDNGNFFGDITVNGGTLQISGNNNALGSNRGITTIGATGTLQFNDSRSTGEFITYEQGATVTKLAAASGTLSGKQTFNNTTAAGLVFDIPTHTTVTSVGLNISGIIYGSNGFTKTGDGILQISANNFADVYDGYTGINAEPTLLGQIKVDQGILYVGGSRALGAFGAGNETIVASGATVDLRDQDLNLGDDSNLSREIFKIQGTGVNGTGALRNSAGTGQVSFLTLDGNATINSGGTANASAFIIGTFDTNLSNANGLTGAFTRNRPVIDGNGNDLTIIGGRNSTDNMILADPDFSSPLGSLNIAGSSVRIRHEVSAALPSVGITSADITNGITIGYAGQSLADVTNSALGLGANTGARLLFENQWNTHNTVDITMDGALAATNNGYNYLQVDFFTIPDGTTFLDGDIALTGTANRNFLISDSIGNYSVAEQGNTTVAPASKLVVGGQITGTGGFTKTGFSEVRLTNDNTFTGELNVLRGGTSAAPWESHTYQINGVDYATNGLAEGWAEWGLTLNGSGVGDTGKVSGVTNINLQRRGMITLDNTTRLDATSGVTGGNDNDRINDAASFSMENGWLRLKGGTADNTESLATAGGAKMNVNSGTNLVDLYPTDGAGTNMTLAIGEITRAAGSVLRFQNLDATSTFSTSAVGESVRVALNTIGTLTAVGAAAGTTDKKVVIGLLGGTIPLGLDTDLRLFGFNNGNATDLWNQQRNLQFLTGSHFMTYDGGYLRPLDDSEYYDPNTASGLINSTSGAAGQNVNLTDLMTIMNGDTTINALRFGPLSDNNGSGGTVQTGTTLTSLTEHHSIGLYVDGTMTIASGMISSAYFTVGNTSSLSTIIYGGNLDFGTREAIINNQNGTFFTTSGVISTGNLEIRSNIMGSGGLMKTGLARVVLDGQNSYTGITSISEGELYIRNGRTALGAGGAGNGVVLTGSGSLFSGNGIQVGTAVAREDIYIGVLNGDQQIVRTETDVTNWFSNVTIDNVDASGQVLFTPRIRTDNSATAILNGNIFGGNTAVTNDITAIDSRIVQFDTAGNNVFIIRGQIGDKDGGSGNAVPIPDPISTLPTLAGVRTNENEVLRVTFAGGTDESNFILEQQYNAVGRLTLSRGTTLITYDPTIGDGTGFWTDTAISKIPNADSTTTAFAINGSTSQQGFVMGTTSNLYNALFLTRDGQNFNMASWSTVGTGAKFIGGLNETGTVTFGNGTGTLSNNSTQSQLYAASGGTVAFNQRMAGNSGTAPASLGIIKVGRGTVELQNTSLNTAADSNFELAAGTLILNHDGVNIARVGNQNAVFSGGTLIALASTSANSTANIATDNAAARVLQFRLGGNEIIARTTASRNMTVNLGNANANGTTPTSNLTRTLGSTVNFVEDNAGGGTAQITLQFNATTTALQKNAVIPWATFGTASRTAIDFAMSDAGAANDVKAFGRAADEYVDAVGSWSAGMDVSEQDGSGFNGALAGNLSISTLRFNSASESVVDLGTNVLTVAGTGLAQSSGAVLVSSNVGGANKTITGGAGSGLTTTGGLAELILHQYSTGNLNVNVPITGAINVTINGPSSVDAATIGTTGAVVMGAPNTYTGRTIINGAVLSFNDVNALGVNPGTATANQVTFNGGTLRFTGRGFTDMSNRGFTFEGSGGTIDVVEASATLRTDSIASQSLYRGDLIKVGAGTLGIEGTNAANANFFGMIDVREGTLRLNGDFPTTTSTAAITTTLLGSSNSYADGTIFRAGTNLAIQMGNRNDASDWNIDEWLTFEGTNYVSVGTINTVTGVTPTGFPNPNNERPINLNGIITIAGTTTFDVVSGQTLRLNNGGTGYTTGNGDIVKDGQGTMLMMANSPDFTGNIIIKQGRFYGLGQADILGTGYLTGKTITLGSADRQGVAELFMNSESAVQNWTVELNHDVEVVYNPTQTKRLAFETLANGGLNQVNGDITLNDNLQLYINDGAEVGGSQNYVNFNGQFKDGATTSGNLVLYGDDAGNANDNTSGRPVSYFVFNNDNSLWTGDVHISANTSYDQDQTSVLRLGHALALTAANDVTMNFNSFLQVGGQFATIGGLTTNGGTGQFYGTSNAMYASTNGSTEIVENAASTPGTLTITQTTPVAVEQVWDAHFRDGTLNSQFFAPGTNTDQPSAALNVVKAGNGWATLTVDNHYTGTTTVAAGVLQVGKANIGDTGASTAAGTTVLSGATLAGTGVVQGASTINSGGFVNPGDLAGNAQGTLNFNGDATFSSGSTLTMQVQRASYNNAPHVGYDAGAGYTTWINGIPTDAYSTALTDPVLTSQHDKINVLGTLTWAAGTKVTLVNNGYTPSAGDIFNMFDWFNVASGAFNAGSAIRSGGETGTDLDLFDLGGSYFWDTSLFTTNGILVVVIPEPGRMALLLLGLVGFLVRRRRCSRHA